MADGLTPRQLRAELAEHGSRKAVATAHPELAEWLDGARWINKRWGEQWRAITNAIENTVPPLSEPEDILPEPMFELRVQREIADEIVALRRELVAPAVTVGAHDDEDVHPRSKPEPYPTALFWKVIAMLVEGATLTEIEDETKLSYNRVVKIRDWRAHPNQLGPSGSPGYKLYPGEPSATLVLRKLRKPR
jgi:hypothetical protein